MQNAEIPNETNTVFGYSRQINDTLSRLEKDDISGRIWRKDFTVWGKEPEDIADRLGWLNVSRNDAGERS